ncbi:MAG: hypothetical protein ABI939_09165 [Anaerolineaceae bacterium]
MIAYPAGRRCDRRIDIETPIGPGAVGMNLNNIKVCARCGLRYDWRKSPSTALKMTYCSSLCERADLGFTIEALLKLERGEKVTPAEEPTVAAV